MTHCFLNSNVHITSTFSSTFCISWCRKIIPLDSPDTKNQKQRTKNDHVSPLCQCTPQKIPSAVAPLVSITHHNQFLFLPPNNNRSPWWWSSLHEPSTTNNANNECHKKKGSTTLTLFMCYFGTTTTTVQHSHSDVSVAKGSHWSRFKHHGLYESVES